MEAIIYSRVSTDQQNYERQIINLKEIAQKKGWIVKRTFSEKISGTIKENSRREYNKMYEYIIGNNIKLVLVSEVSRLSRRVVDVLNIVEELHEKQVGIYIQQFNMISFENGQENSTVKLLLQMLAIGSEMETNLRKERQREGINLAKLNGKYNGRKPGAITNNQKLLDKYHQVVTLLQKSDLSLREISSVTQHSINTIRKVKNILTLVYH